MGALSHRGSGFLAALSGVALLLAAAGRAADPAASRVLSLDDCIREALARNHELRIARYEPQIASNRLRLARADYDPTLKVDAERESEEAPGGLDEFNSPVTGSESDSMRYTASVGGLLPFGASYSVNATTVDTEGDKRSVDSTGGSSFLPFEASSGRATFLELRQPLLKNAWIDETRTTVRIRRADLRSSELALRGSLLSVVASVEQAYFDLLAARETVRVRRAALDLAERLVRENSLRVQIGVMEPLDERQAQAQLAASRADLLDARRAQAIQENTLENLISDDVDAWAGIAIEPAESLGAAPEDLDAARSREMAFQNRPDLHRLILDLERRRLVTSLQRNQLFPQLDLVGTYGHAASSDELAGTIDQLGEGSFPFHAIGLSFSMPLGNRRARETYRTGVAERARAEDQLRQARQTVVVEVENAVVAARSSFERVAATREAREFAEAALAAGETKLANGKLRSFEVLQLQRDLTSARAEEVRALADYNKSLALLRHREGSTLRHRRIDVETEAAP
jgi:outer membrane protein TolC